MNYIYFQIFLILFSLVFIYLLILVPTCALFFSVNLCILYIALIFSWFWSILVAV